MNWRQNILLVCSALACVGALTSLIGYHSFPVPTTARAGSTSQVVVAENGELLRAYLAADGRWRLTTRPEDVDRRYLDTLLRYEDRRFYEHHGVDVFALARVGSQFLRHGRVVSGASTLTMQVFRLLNPGITGFRGKLLQILGAIQLERRLSKHDILATYLTLAPFGGNVEGVRAASLFYFGKEPIDLTLKESALLVAISQAPNRRRPDRNPLAAAEARDRVLNRLGDLAPTARMLRPATAARPLVGPRAFLAPHFADRVRLLAPGDETIRTTIDASLQAKLEQMVRETLQDWPGKVNAAVLVVRNADSAVRAYVGGSDFFSFENAGQLDHVRAVRSPGSTLKPAIYGLGFEGLIIHPSTIVTDRPVVFDGYAPQNFNEEYQGDMTVREALIKSINTTAVTILARITPALLLTRLRNADIPIQLDDVDTSAGLAVALGGGGMTLESLTRLYSGLANEGLVRPLRMLASSPDTGGKRVLNRESTRSVVDILADVPPPNGFGRRHAKDGGRRIAYKTGTSFGYRDAWAIGFDGIHTVGIWIGRSDAAPNPGALGVTAAAPLLYRAFDMLPVPGSDVAGRSSQSNAFANQANLPSRLYRLSSGLGRQHAPTLRIVFPSKGSVVAAEKDGDGAFFIPLIADGGRPPYFWFVDGASLPSSDAKIRWRTNGRGSVSATLMDSNGETSTVEFWIK